MHRSPTSLPEVDGERDDVVRTTRRTNRGFPLCVWGEARADAFRIRRPHELTDVLDLFHLIASDEPQMIRIWSAGDDQVVAIVWRDDCALYVVESVGGYGSSAGDPARLGGFDAQDHGGSPITVAWADCIDWSVARSALIHFVEHGEVGGDVELTGSIPSGFLMLGDYDRTSIIGARGEPTPVFAETSLHRMVPTTRPTHLDLGLEDTWAERVIAGLSSMGFVDVYGPLRATVIEQLAGLLDAYGEDAIARISTADWLANELVCMRGVMRFDATGGDLQVALHHAR
ncbi:MAG: hypothetical protein NT062_01495 [Proteobacteria bacterium]|nr:hypothetical protein [Pseudomonadota bacterium]